MFTDYITKLDTFKMKNQINMLLKSLMQKQEMEIQVEYICNYSQNFTCLEQTLPSKTIIKMLDEKIKLLEKDNKMLKDYIKKRLF
jgi:hypothetical protein